MTGPLQIADIPTAAERRAFYESVAATDGFQARMYYTPHNVKRGQRTRELLGMILPFAPKVFELGCADGIMSRWIAARCQYLVGIDIAGVCIRRCEALGLPNAEFHRGELEDIASIGDFDLAVATEVLEHVPDPQETVHRLGSMARGILATVPTNEEPTATAFRTDRYHHPQWIGDGAGHITSFRRDTFCALFRDIWHYEEFGITALVVGR